MWHHLAHQSRFLCFFWAAEYPLQISQFAALYHTCKKGRRQSKVHFSPLNSVIVTLQGWFTSNEIQVQWESYDLLILFPRFRYWKSNDCAFEVILYLPPLDSWANSNGYIRYLVYWGLNHENQQYTYYGIKGCGVDFTTILGDVLWIMATPIFFSLSLCAPLASSFGCLNIVLEVGFVSQILYIFIYVPQFETRSPWFAS